MQDVKIKVLFIFILIVSGITSDAYNKHEHLGDLFTQKNFAEAFGVSRFSEIVFPKNSKVGKPVFSQVMKTMIAFPKPPDVDPDVVTKLGKLKSEVLNDSAKLTKALKEIDVPKLSDSQLSSYKQFRAESLEIREFLKKSWTDMPGDGRVTIDEMLKHAKESINRLSEDSLVRANRYFGDINIADDLISYNPKNILGNSKKATDSFSEMGKLRKELIRKMNGEQINTLVESFKQEVPHFNRSAMDISLDKALYDSINKKLQPNTLGKIMSEVDSFGAPQTNVQFLLTYSGGKVDIADPAKVQTEVQNLIKLKRQDPYIKGIDIVPSMIEHVDGAALPKSERTIPLIKEILKNPELTDADIRLHIFEGKNKSPAYYDALWDLLEDDDYQKLLGERSGKIRFGHSGTLDLVDIKRINQYNLNNKILIEFNPVTYKYLGGQSTEELGKKLKLLLDNNIEVVFGADSLGIYNKTSSFSDVLSDIVQSANLSEEQRGKLLRTLHENDLPEKHLLKVHQMIVGKNFSLDSHERILKHIFQIQGCSPLSTP